MKEFKEEQIMEGTNLQVGDKVVPSGKLRQVVDFLATADKEILRLLSSFFEPGCSPITDAKRLQKPHVIKKIYKETLDISINRGEDVWEEKIDYWKKEESSNDPDS